MTDLSLEQKIAFAAVQYDRARVDVLRLAKRRSAFTCERCEGEHETRSQEQFKPCWKDYEDTYDGDQRLAAESDWCASCQGRQAVHREYQAATKKRGARLRELHRLCELAGGWQIAPTIKLLTQGDSPLG